MSIRSFYASQDISIWMNTRILNPFVLRMHILTCVKVILTIARVKAVLALARKLFMLMDRLAICLLLYLCLCLRL